MIINQLELYFFDSNRENSTSFCESLIILFALLVDK